MILPPNLSTMPFIQLQILQPVASLPRRICQNRSQNQELTQRKLKHRYSNTDRKNRLCFINLDLLCLQSSIASCFDGEFDRPPPPLDSNFKSSDTIVPKRHSNNDNNNRLCNKISILLHQVAFKPLVLTVSSIGLYSL